MPGRAYVDIQTINGTNWYGVVVDPNGLLVAPIGSVATLKTGPMIWVNADGLTTWNVVYPVVVPPGSITAITLWGNGDVSPTTTTRYLMPGYSDDLAPIAPIQWTVPRAGVFRNLRVRHNVPAGNGNPIVYTLRVNGVVSILSASVPSNVANGSDLVNMVPVVAGDLLDIEVTKALDVVVSPTGIVVDAELA